MSDIQKALIQGLAALNLNSEPLCDVLLRYSRLLQKWNHHYNLTAITDPSKIVTAHFLDSLSVYPFLQGDRCLDVGTGAGFPGLVLALAAPQRQWILLDSSIKKIRFITQARIELALDNVEVVHARVDKYKHHSGFTSIVSRALFSAIDLYQNSRHLLGKGGCILVMKGVNYQLELTALQQQKIAYRVHSVRVPVLEQDRYLIDMRANKSI